MINKYSWRDNNICIETGCAIENVSKIKSLDDISIYNWFDYCNYVFCRLYLVLENSITGR